MSVSSGTLTNEGAIPLDQSLWSSFANARTDGAQVTGWLAVLVNRIPAAVLGVVFEADHGAGAMVPVAVVPDPRRDLGAIRAITEQVLGSARPATLPSEDGLHINIGYPLRGASGQVETVIALELATSDSAVAQAALRDIHWASGWIKARIWETQAHDDAARLRRSGVALDILSLGSEHAKPEAAAMAIVNEAQSLLECDQISIGLIRGARTAPRIKLLAMSYSAWFRKRSALVEALETAMEEVYDQNATVAWPPVAGTARAISVAHADHVRSSRTAHMLSVPLSDESGPIGVMTCERREDRAFDSETHLTAEAIAALIGPVLELKRRNRRWFGGRLVDGTVHVLGVLLGPRRLSWKLLALVLIGLGVAAATVTGPFRIQADAVLQGAQKRVASAPFAGYIAEAPYRAGDTVRAGDLLVRLDDTDMVLEELRWRSEIDRLISQVRTAQADYDRSQVALLEAQIEQARAQLTLAQAELSRTRVLAPMDGLIVSGDLSQKLGAPVQLGEVLFEIAPVDQFRIDIYVDERDLRHVSEGQTARLILTGRPEGALAIRTQRITPVAEARSGANTFRVEAELVDTPPPGLRPGMQGLAKIDAGEALVAWAATRRLVDWLRETAWTWQP
jgi:RND family efflux transporter MFP subunit